MDFSRGCSSGWKSFEILDSEDRTPFSLSLASSGKTAVQAVTKMRMVQELGWPEAKRSLKDDQGRARIVKKDNVIWLLKCKPSCWRLYFYVWEDQENKQIIYVHAICKKSDDEDPSDAKEARRIADSVRSGENRITAFEFPTR